MIDFDELRRRNIARREAHPGWPTHTSILYLPHQPPQIMSFCVPVRKARKRAYCKYCYTTHANWWLMDRDDYFIPNDPDDAGLEMFLCGDCEHTSRSDFL